jgi:hypothetical protein
MIAAYILGALAVLAYGAAIAYQPAHRSAPASPGDGPARRAADAVMVEHARRVLQAEGAALHAEFDTDPMPRERRTPADLAQIDTVLNEVFG